MNPFNIAILLLESAVQTIGIRAGVEQPQYHALLRDGPLELRDYPSRLVAETVVSGEENAARNAGFRKIAAYIFGANHGAREVAMTAPVAQGASQSIDMTSPVAQSATSQGWKVQFTMPAKYHLDTLPAPNDPSVRLLEEPGARYAVLRFSGDRSPHAVGAQTKALVQAVTAHGWRPEGAALAWFYDPPWTIPGLRRNEVAIRVAAGPIPPG